ncbi:transposase [Paenibacillus eucommiae]|uniref:Transposase n=2 Tax=Paenibacillus eucommiae TaxID=1355755 RepID=A0ABS4ITG8_9BACL|nr:transposase [Paenibacillus eucommiae]
MDLPIHGKQVGLLIKRQRYHCRDCNQTFWERLDCTIDEKRNCTKRLLSYIEKQSIQRTFVSISEDIGINEKTIRNIFRDYINRLEETTQFETPNWLGIDEIHIMNKPRCVFTNTEERKLIDLLQNRNKETVVEYLSRLRNKDRIQYVTMDMCQPYKDAVKAVLPRAIIIVDKFHIVRMANQALETIRKQLREGCHKELTEMKESYFDIWDCDNRQKAFLKYNAWKAKIPTELQSAFEPLIKAMKNWEEEIFAYFDHHTTNAYTESLRSLIRAMNRLGRGYSFEVLRAKMLFTEGLPKERRPYVKV